MRRSAAARIVSRVVLPSRVLAVELGVGVGVLVVLTCTNRSVQRLSPVAHRVKCHGGPEMAPHPPTLGAPRETRGAPRFRGRPGVKRIPRRVTAPPGRSEPPGGLRGGPPRSVTAPPGRSEPPGGLRGALRGASRLRPDAPSHPEVLGGALRGASRLRPDAPSHPEVLEGRPLRGASRLRPGAPSHLEVLGGPSPRSVTAPPGRSEPPGG